MIFEKMVILPKIFDFRFKIWDFNCFKFIKTNLKSAIESLKLKTFQA